MLKVGDSVTAHIGPKGDGTDIVGSVLEEVRFSGVFHTKGYKVLVESVGNPKQSWAVGKTIFVKGEELAKEAG
jgi:hypothetical protein